MSRAVFCRAGNLTRFDLIYINKADGFHGMAFENGAPVLPQQPERWLGRKSKRETGMSYGWALAILSYALAPC